MGRKKSITIRFNLESQADMHLYRLLEQEAGSYASLASVAKARIRDSYRSIEQNSENMALQEQLIRTIREEMQEVGFKIVGTLISCMGGASAVRHIATDTQESQLPEESDELPSGALDFLDD